jgi:hypothetical protein
VIGCSQPFPWLGEETKMLGLASTLFTASVSGTSAVPPATATSTGTSFYESPHKIFSPVQIDGHSTLVSSLEKSVMKVREINPLFYSPKLKVFPYLSSGLSFLNKNNSTMLPLLEISNPPPLPSLLMGPFGPRFAPQWA